MQLAQIRQIEAVGFRAWPASSVHYDGSWAIRMTASHPSKRLNSVNPLDPGDIANMEQRVTRAAQRFRAYGRPPDFPSVSARATRTGSVPGRCWVGRVSINRWS